MPAIKSNALRAAASRMRELIRSSGSPLFTCSLTRRPVPVKPHGDSFVEPDGSILFFVDPSMVAGGEGTHRAQLFYPNTRDMIYLSVTGNGELVDDPAVISKWRSKQSGSGTIPDSDLLIRVKPVSAFCWNTKTGALDPLVQVNKS
jgi:hypothetical protein